MCAYDFEWHWDGDGHPTVWAPGLGTCCRSTRSPGEPGVLLVENTDDEDWPLCPDCEGDECRYAPDDYGDPVEAFPFNRPVHRELIPPGPWPSWDAYRIGCVDDYGNWIAPGARTLGVCRTCDGEGSIRDRPLRTDWMCQFCVVAGRWLHVICGGMYYTGGDVVPAQVVEHWEEGFGGRFSAPLAFAAGRGWKGWSVAMVSDLVEDAIRHDQLAGV